MPTRGCPSSGLIGRGRASSRLARVFGLSGSSKGPHRPEIASEARLKLEPASRWQTTSENTSQPRLPTPPHRATSFGLIGEELREKRRAKLGMRLRWLRLASGSRVFPEKTPGREGPEEESSQSWRRW